MHLFKVEVEHASLLRKGSTLFNVQNLIKFNNYELLRFRATRHQYQIPVIESYFSNEIMRPHFLYHKFP